MLNFWAMGREGEVVEELVREFEQENPTIRVRVQQLPWSSAHEKLLTAFAGDALPDLCQLGNTWIPEFVAIRSLEDLSHKANQSKIIEKSDYFQGIWDTNTIGDATYGIPWYVDTRVIFYRKDILAAAGVSDFPNDWDAWLAAMRRIKKHVGEENYAILLPTNEWAMPVTLGLQTGSPLLRDGGRYGDFRSPEFRRAFDFYTQLFEEQLAPSSDSTAISNVHQEFERGYFAMYVTGPWNIGEFQRRMPSDGSATWGTAPMPGPNGTASGCSLAGGSSLAIFRTSKHKEEAWKLIEFLSRPNIQARFYELSGDLPPRKSVWKEMELHNDEYAAAFYQQLERVLPTPKVPEWERITAKIFQAAETAIRGKKTTDETLVQLDKTVDSILEKRRWMLDNSN